MQSMYFQLYTLLQTYIYGAETVLTPDMELTLTLLSTCGALIVVLLPFALVWRIIGGK